MTLRDGRMDAEESQRFGHELAYAEAAHRAYAEALGEKWTRAKWLALQPRERGAWMAVTERVADLLARSVLV